MDPIDRTIVRLLQKDGRLSHEQISREVHLSRPAVHDRIRRLEAAGVIRGYRAEVDWESVGLPVTAFIQIRTTGDCYVVSQHILALTSEQSTVAECHRIAGDWCLLVKTHSASPLALQALLDEIRVVPGVQNTMTTFVLSTVPQEAACAVPARAGEPR